MAAVPRVKILPLLLLIGFFILRLKFLDMSRPDDNLHLKFAPDTTFTEERPAASLLFTKYDQCRGAEVVLGSTRVVFRRRMCLVYWLLALSGDIEVNPGPVRHPCSVCQRSVKSNQRGICCDNCDRWSHAKCACVSLEEYERLGEDSKVSWNCPPCILSELPGSDSLDPSTGSWPSFSESVSMQDLNGGVLVGPRVGILFAHLNVRSILPKCQQLQVLMEGSTNAVFGMSETWLNGTIGNAEIDMPNMKLFRKDRNGRSGGGVLVYVSENIKSFRRRDLELDEIEAVWIELIIKGMKVLVCNVYRPPDAKACWMDDFSVMMEKAANEREERVVMGDFNCNMMNIDYRGCRLE